MNNKSDMQASDDLLSKLRASCEELIRQGLYTKALEQLLEKQEQLCVNDRPADYDALLGQAYFLSEQYEEACQHYVKALEQNPEQKEWQQMLETSRNNSTSRVDIFVPDIVHFKEHELLSTPKDPELPPPIPQYKLPYQLHKLRYLRPFIGRTVGLIGSFTFNTATKLFGSGYNGPQWTDWYNRPWLKGILNLARMRDDLNERNLNTTYPEHAAIAFQDKNQPRPCGIDTYRTADGSWNNVENPKEGAAHTRFLRNVDALAIKPDKDLMEPNPREVSLKLLTRGEKMKEAPFLNMLAASWIQFQNHDWISHGENALDDLIKIPLPEDDPARTMYGQDYMTVARTQPDPTYGKNGAESTPISYVNEVTHWWDGSQIYGSDLETQLSLRSGVDGRLKLTKEGHLTLNHLGTEHTGFNRNWWVGLSMLHTLFSMEHNSICDHLKFYYPSWTDDQLFNVARLVNAAVMAKIHSVEWTPAVLPNNRLNTALNSNWYGLLTYLFGDPNSRKTVAAFKVQNPELGGLVGNSINKHGCPYGLTEEFVEVYRLHSFLQEALKFRDHRTDALIEEKPLAATRQSGSPSTIDRIGLDNLFYSFGNQHPGYLGLNNYPKFMQHMSIPGNPLMDLGAVDILRARERGVPRYNEFRRQLNLKPIDSFDQLTEDATELAKLKEVYGDDVEKLDLLIGTLAESHRPTGFGFGETMFQIFILNASRRLQSDRFFTDDFKDDVYTREGMKWIDGASLKSVLLRHFPQLEETGLGNVTNAFEPWDTEYRLSEERHPLRQYSPEHKKNPWKGDAY